MTFAAFERNVSDGPIDVQLHYDHLSKMAHICSSVFDGVLPSRYPTPESAADAARAIIESNMARGGQVLPRRSIRIWLR
jgi:hypothetical protein